MTTTSEHLRARQPAEYVAHGGGPWPWMEDPRGWWADIDRHLRGLAASLPTRPAAVVVITAHWEAPTFTVASGATPGLIYDYYGFPAHTYEVTYPAVGAPEVAAELHRLAAAAGIETIDDPEYGWDHGVFVPLHVTHPEGDVPIVAVSLKRGLDPAEHLAFGRAIAPLRERNVLILGSGMSTHDLSGRVTETESQAFDRWLEEVMSAPEPERDAGLARWADAPGGRASHPREEHLLPLMVVAGAGGAGPARRSLDGLAFGHPVAAYRFD